MNLTNTQLFRGMTQAEIDQLLHCLGAAERQYVKGSVIFPEGEPTAYLGVVRRGRVLRVLRRVRTGRNGRVFPDCSIRRKLRLPL